MNPYDCRVKMIRDNAAFADRIIVYLSIAIIFCMAMGWLTGPTQ